MTFQEIEDSILEDIFCARYAWCDEGCPSCDNVVEYKRIKTRLVYQCPKCYYQINPLANCFFDKTHLPLQVWKTIINIVEDYPTFPILQIQKEILKLHDLKVSYPSLLRIVKPLRVIQGIPNDAIGVDSLWYKCLCVEKIREWYNG